MEHFWFIEESSFLRYNAAVAKGETLSPNPEKIEAIRGNADRWASKAYTSEHLVVRGNEAHISISGVLLQAASYIDEMYAKYFGEIYSTYSGIITQIASAEDNAQVEKIIFHVDSPGGMMAGVDEAAQAIFSSSKPTEARVGWCAASAAYYLASQANNIVATTPSASFGSIGVVVDLVDMTGIYEKYGVKFYSLTSTKAPDKRQEPHSEEFKQKIVKRLDALHEVFAGRVAAGRSRATGEAVSIDKVSEDFGKGGMLIASEALKAGMIDGVVSIDVASEPDNTKEVEMAEERTLTQAFDEGIEQGAQHERARVVALLPWMGADSELVIAAIENGDSLSPEMVADLSRKAAEQAQEAATVTAAQETAAQETAAASEREEDEAPVVEAVVTQEDEEASEDDMVTAALAQSKVKPVKGAK